MRSNYMMAALAAAAMSMPSMVILGQSSGQIATALAPHPDIVQRKALLGSTKVRYRRPKRAQAKPRSKPNRVTIGRRVRRKHRRAA